MRVAIDDRLRKICNEIIKCNYSLDEWSQRESDDLFQCDRYQGGFDATEQAFCFSYYNDEGEEYWFQITLDEVKKILRGEISKISSRKAE